MEEVTDDLDLSIVEDDSSEEDSLATSSCSDEEEFNERENLSEIDIFFIYINLDNAIDKVEKMVEPLWEPISDSFIGITKERLLQIVQTKRLYDDKKYRLDEIMAFQIPLEYADLESFIKGDSTIGDECFRTVPIFNEVVIQPALYIFHDLTALYFFFSEDIKPLKSVLRNGSENRVTKKVRIVDNSLSYDVRKKKSLKRFLRRGTRKISETI
jgi:hypothetical protein